MTRQQTKSKRKKRIRQIVFASVFAILIYCFFYINSLIPIFTGYPAKFLCSAIFASGRDQSEVEVLDLHFSFVRFVKNVVNRQDSSVASSFLWGSSKAIYRKGFGATLAHGGTETGLRKIKYPEVKLNWSPDTVKWPTGNLMPKKTTGADTLRLERIAEKLLDEEGYNGHAFGFMVVHKGVPVVEAYQPQYNEKTRFLSWSMAKSITGALAGILVKDGTWRLDQSALLPEWKNDDRAKITINDLLQMQSGLKWNESYGNRSDVTLMLFCQSDFARFTFEKPLKYPAGTHWEYSSGAVNILNYLMRKTIGNDAGYYQFAQTRLYDKIGMQYPVFEVDASGTQVGSSYFFASVRDYARFGLLYLNDGLANGERILPEGWVKYTATPASDSKGGYGALFWLNQSGFYPSAPADMYSCSGHDGQEIFIIPSKELVIVVVGYSPGPKNSMKFDELLGDILKTV
jgi:CubicO group peptidase (beta-lactamase class C family)